MAAVLRALFGIFTLLHPTSLVKASYISSYPSSPLQNLPSQYIPFIQNTVSLSNPLNQNQMLPTNPFIQNTFSLNNPFIPNTYPQNNPLSQNTIPLNNPANQNNPSQNPANNFLSQIPQNNPSQNPANNFLSQIPQNNPSQNPANNFLSQIPQNNPSQNPANNFLSQIPQNNPSQNPANNFLSQIPQNNPSQNPANNFLSQIPQNYPLVQNNIFSPQQLQQPIQAPNSGYDQLSTCFYLNMKSSVPVTQQVPTLSYLMTDSRAAEIVLQLEYERQMSSLYIGNGNGAFFSALPPADQWTHFCLTWDGKSGLVNAFVDGQQAETVQNVQKGYVIPQNGAWSLDGVQSDVAQVSQLHMWDRALSPAEVTAAKNCQLSGNVFSWESSKLGFEEFLTGKGDQNSPCPTAPRPPYGFSSFGIIG